MTLPASGPITFSEVNVELGLSSTAQISLNDAAVRALFGVPSGAISMSDGYGKANQFAFTISSNQTNANLATLATAAGWNGTSKVIATINSGIYCSSNSTGTPGLTVSGSFPGGVELVNNGYIIGMGGAGGIGGGISTNTLIAGSAGSSGGLALSVASAVSITNNGTIGGGGGGGGGGQGGQLFDGKAGYNLGGGGGGGGRSGATNSSGGAGGTASGFVSASGGAGGAGTSASAGGGGAGGNPGYGRGGNGGSGGGWGAGGASGGNVVNSANYNIGPYGGGAAGAAVSGNSNITWVATGTRLGAIT